VLHAESVANYWIKPEIFPLYSNTLKIKESVICPPCCKYLNLWGHKPQPLGPNLIFSYLCIVAAPTHKLEQTKGNFMFESPCILDKQIKESTTRCNKWWFIGNQLFRNMLRNNWLPINHLLNLFGIVFNCKQKEFVVIRIRYSFMLAWMEDIKISKREWEETLKGILKEYCVMLN